MTSDHTILSTFADGVLKHKRWILTSMLLVSAAAAVVRFGEPIWLAVQYESRSLPGHDLRYLRKRATWLPGNLIVIPDQLCGACDMGEHFWCAVFPKAGAKQVYRARHAWDLVRRAEREYLEASGDVAHDPFYHARGPFRCTCPRVSHDWCVSCQFGDHDEHNPMTVFCKCPDSMHE